MEILEKLLPSALWILERDIDLDKYLSTYIGGLKCLWAQRQ